MSDERQASSTNPARLTANDIANRAFASSFRGLSESEVRAFLRKVGEDLEALAAREAALADEVEALRSEVRAPRPLDEGELLQALGEETASLLKNAKDAARDIRAKADDAAARTRAEAQEDADRMRSEAAEVLDIKTREADARVAEMLAEATATADAMRNGAERYAEDVRLVAEKEADELRARGGIDADARIEAAKEQGRNILEEARGLRERVLADLSHRRGLLQMQIAELRTGREHLLDAFRTVKRTFVEATESLAAAEARAAETRPVPVDEAEIQAIMARDVSDETALHLQANLATDTGETPAVAATDTEPAEPAESVESVEAVPPAESIEPADGIDGSDADAETPQATATVDLTAEEAAEPQAEPTAAPAAGDSGEEAAADQELEPAADDDDDDDEPATRPDADSLFARIRAETDRKEAEAAAALEAQADTGGTDGSDAPAVDVTLDTVGAAPEADSPAAVDADADVDVAMDGDDGPGPADVVHAAITELSVGALRRAKRRAQDDQNELLDALRRTRGRATSAGVLPELDAHVEAWAHALREWVEGAYRSGGGDELDADVLSALVRQLVEPMRERLELAIDSGDEDVSERVNARYREWKSQHLDSSVSDLLAAAHAFGVFDTAADGVTLQWVIAAGGCCAECADNVLEPTRRGEPFPTGHRLPPAHVGCRCTIIATSVPTTAAELSV